MVINTTATAIISTASRVSQPDRLRRRSDDNPVGGRRCLGSCEILANSVRKFDSLHKAAYYRSLPPRKCSRQVAMGAVSNFLMYPAPTSMSSRIRIELSPNYPFTSSSVRSRHKSEKLCISAVLSFLLCSCSWGSGALEESSRRKRPLTCSGDAGIYLGTMVLIR